MFRDFVLPVLEYCSAVWCSAADTHLKLLDRIVSGSSFITGGAFEYDLAHRRSVEVLCILYKIRHNNAPSLWCSTRAVCDGACYTRFCNLTSVHLCASSLQNLAVSHDFYFHLSISVKQSCWLRIRWCGTGGFQEQGQCRFIGLAAHSSFVSYCFHFLFFHSMSWYWGAGVFWLIGC